MARRAHTDIQYQVVEAAGGGGPARRPHSGRKHSAGSIASSGGATGGGGGAPPAAGAGFATDSVVETHVEFYGGVEARGLGVGRQGNQCLVLTFRPFTFTNDPLIWIVIINHDPIFYK
jgi:hypothetical protein